MVESICWIRATSIKPFWKKLSVVCVWTVAVYWDPKPDSLIALGRINNNIYKGQII